MTTPYQLKRLNLESTGRPRGRQRIRFLSPMTTKNPDLFDRSGDPNESRSKELIAQAKTIITS